MIKNLILTLFLFVILSAMSTSLLGVEFVFRGNKGYEHYSCGSNNRGGIVRVKALGKNKYQIFGKRLSGEFEISLDTVDNKWCLGNVGAARVACGFCRLKNEDELPFSNLVE